MNALFVAVGCKRFTWIERHVQLHNFDCFNINSSFKWFIRFTLDRYLGQSRRVGVTDEVGWIVKSYLGVRQSVVDTSVHEQTVGFLKLCCHVEEVTAGVVWTSYWISQLECPVSRASLLDDDVGDVEDELLETVPHGFIGLGANYFWPVEEAGVG